MLLLAPGLTGWIRGKKLQMEEKKNGKWEKG
jgi:hypothetical protein